MKAKRLPIIDERIKAQQAKVLEKLEKSGNVSFSCKSVGISRETFYRWKEEDSAFAKLTESAINFGKSYVNDLAHHQLISKLCEGDMQAIRFQLANCHDDYRPKLPERIERVVPITAVEIIDASRVERTKKKEAPP